MVVDAWGSYECLIPHIPETENADYIAVIEIKLYLTDADYGRMRVVDPRRNEYCISIHSSDESGEAKVYLTYTVAKSSLYKSYRKSH